jgi:hypothetical protein
MILNGWFGHPSTWFLLVTVWLGLGLLTAITFGMLARVGGEDDRHDPR